MTNLIHPSLARLLPAFGLTLSLALIGAQAVTPAQANRTAAAPDSAGEPVEDIAILIQAGHRTPPNKAIVYHREQASYLETWDDLDVRLWRRFPDATDWQLLRHWKNLGGGWAHAPMGEKIFFSNFADGHFQIYDARDFSLLRRHPIDYRRGSAPSAWRSSPAAEYSALFGLPYRTPDGADALELLVLKNGAFEAWQPFGDNNAVTGVRQLANNLFAVRAHSHSGDSTPPGHAGQGSDQAGLPPSRWSLFSLNDSGETQPVAMPALNADADPETLRKLGNGVIALGFGRPELRAQRDKGRAWAFYAWDFKPAAKHSHLERIDLGIDPARIMALKPMGESAFQLRERSEPNQDVGQFVSYFMTQPGGKVTPMHQAVGGLSERQRAMRVLGESRIVGAMEMNDADGNGTPGDWVWRALSRNGNWMPVHSVFPNLGNHVWRVADALDGKAIGFETMASRRSSETQWHWYLRTADDSDWTSLNDQLPLPDALRVPGQISEYNFIRDGLLELRVESEREPIAGIPLAARQSEWMMRGADGVWISVRDLVENTTAGLGERIIKVDARNDGLMVDVKRNAESAPLRLVFYRQRDGQWTRLDNQFGAFNQRSAATDHPLPRIQSAKVLNDTGLILLQERKDANFDGIRESHQVLQRQADGRWQILHSGDLIGARNTSLRYDSERDLLIRRNAASLGGQSTRFFMRTDDSTNAGWIDLIQAVPDAPPELGDAFRFAEENGRRLGLALTEHLDADGDGQFAEQSFWLQDGTRWRPLHDVLPIDWSSIQNVLDAGDSAAIGVQEYRDADGNGIANQWHYFFKAKTGVTAPHADQPGEWVSLSAAFAQLPPEFNEVEMSGNGQLVNAREHSDSNGNHQVREFFVGVWNSTNARFEPLLDQISPLLAAQPAELRSAQPSAAKLLWSTDSSLGVAVYLESTTNGWFAFERDAQGNWHSLTPGGGNRLAAIQADTNGRLFAARVSQTGPWQLFTRASLTEPFAPAPTLSEAQQLEIGASAALASGWLKSRAGNDQPWTLWQLGRGSAALSSRGTSGTGNWFGFEHQQAGKKRLRINAAQHFIDGHKVEHVPQPLLWLHRDPTLPAQQNVVFAPSVIDQALRAESGLARDGDNALDGSLSVEALGIGESGSVLVYRANDSIGTTTGNGAQLIVAGFSGGRFWSEDRALNTDDPFAFAALLVNRLADGSERQMRAAQPDRWIWSYQHDHGRIYFDRDGHFYSDTQAASELLSFRVGREIHSFNQMGSYLFRPDLLEQRLGVPTGSLFELTQRDVNQVDAAQKLAPQGASVGALHPPTLNVSTSRSVVSEPQIELDIHAQGIGVTAESISVRILGAGQARSVPRRPKGRDQRKLQVRKSVPLVPGKNQIEVTIHDANGLSDSVRLAITYQADETHKPTLYAAVVATANYQPGLDLAPLPLTQNDARTIEAALQRQIGKRFAEVKVKRWCQSDGCQSEPTRQRLSDELPAFLAQARHGDYILVYVSGHGLNVGREYFMVPADGDPNLPQTMIAWSEVQGWLRKAKLGKKLVMLDTCQSGAVFDAGGSKTQRHRMVQQAVEHDGIYVLSAAAADASAFEISSLGNGLFTHVVREGLDGGADVGADGRVSFEELSFHVARRVRELSTLQRVRMEPYTPIIDQAMDFPLVDVSREQQLALRVTDLSSFDSSASPARQQWWKAQLSGVSDSLRISSPQTAAFRLVVVEDQGKPLRSQLSSAKGDVLGQWQFHETPVDKMLAKLAELIAPD